MGTVYNKNGGGTEPKYPFIVTINNSPNWSIAVYNTITGERATSGGLGIVAFGVSIKVNVDRPLYITFNKRVDCSALWRNEEHDYITDFVFGDNNTNQWGVAFKIHQ